MAPGFARDGQVSEELADVVALFLGSDLWVATVLKDVRGAVT
ncbi:MULTISPECIES: hypothetical protein [Enterobacteriaceae]|nr:MULTISPECIES: hypothetical protein [Enterobacteriaceae]